MPSNINPDHPAQGKATIASIRTNFLHAKTEIEALQESAGGAGVLCRQAIPPGSGNGPAGPHTPGTLWIDEDTRVGKIWDGSAWQGIL